VRVAGGTYLESCVDPLRSADVFGSGGRAASYLGPELSEFTSYVDQASLQILKARLDRSASLVIHDRAERLGYRYDTPLSRPQEIQRPADRFAMALTGIDLLYGMSEVSVEVEADTLVVDPQHSIGFDQLGTSIQGQIHLVLNSAELKRMVASRLSGSGASSIAESVEVLGNETELSSIVVKCGALGSLVNDGAASRFVPAYETSRVQPIGSGDVFSAAFALSLRDNSDVENAALVASRTTAHFCETGYLGPSVESDRQPIGSMNHLLRPPKIYVASSFHNVEQRWITTLATEAIEGLGGSAFSPLRDVGRVQSDSRRVASEDIAGLRDCDAVLLLADSSRSGPHLEAGVAVEREMPIVVYANDADEGDYTMLRGLGASFKTDLATSIYWAIWAAAKS